MKITLHSTLCAGVIIAAYGSAEAVPVSGQGTWEMTLLARDLDGNVATVEAWYDTLLDITRLALAEHRSREWRSLRL